MITHIKNKIVYKQDLHLTKESRIDDYSCCKPLARLHNYNYIIQKDSFYTMSCHCRGQYDRWVYLKSSVDESRFASNTCEVKSHHVSF